MTAAQQFDARIFGIAPAEAGAMDPQQRLLLEHGYASLHSSSHRRVALSSGESGVFLGIERPDWALAQPPKARGSVYAVTGDNISVAAGRMSFVLGLHGPCSSIDTACAKTCTKTCTKALTKTLSLYLILSATLCPPLFLSLYLCAYCLLDPSVSVGALGGSLLSRSRSSMIQTD